MSRADRQNCAKLMTPWDYNIMIYWMRLRTRKVYWCNWLQLFWSFFLEMFVTGVCNCLPQLGPFRSHRWHLAGRFGHQTERLLSFVRQSASFEEPYMSSSETTEEELCRFPSQPKLRQSPVCRTVVLCFAKVLWHKKQVKNQLYLSQHTCFGMFECFLISIAVSYCPPYMNEFLV